MVSSPLGEFGAHRFEIALADGEIVAHRPLEAGKAEADRLQRLVVVILQLDREAIVLDPEQDPERPVMLLRLEDIAFEQIEDGDLALPLDLLAAADDRPLVQLDIDDPRVGHGILLAGAERLIHIASTEAATETFRAGLPV